MRKVVIGSRESRLAVIQSEIVKKYIEEQNPDIQVEILTMKTTGDIILDKTLDKVGGKGLFVKELDKALMDKRSDISVHSLKDMLWKCLPNSLWQLLQKRRSQRCAGPSQRPGKLWIKQSYRLFQSPKDPSVKGDLSGYGI